MDGALSSARCTRADCTSLREELELLRGDLLELERENELLHEQLADLQSHANASEAKTQQTLQKKDVEIIHLCETVADLTAQLQQRIDAVQSETAHATRASSPEKSDSTPREQELKALKAQNEVFESRLKDLQDQIERETTAGLKAQRRVAQVAEESKDKCSELYTTLKENEILRSEVAEMQEATKTMSEERERCQVSMAAMHDQVEAYRDAVDEQTLEITQLHTKVEQLEQEKLSLEEKLIEMDEKESDVDTLMSNTKAVFEMEKATLVAECNELRRKLKQQQVLHDEQQQHVHDSKKILNDEEEKDNVRGSPSATMDALEKQLRMLQELRIRDKSTILELNQRNLQQQSDLESLAEHLNVDAMVENAVQAAERKQKAKLEGFEQDNITLKRYLKEQRELVHDLELRQGIVEKKLVEAEEWNAKYEQKAGLEDVIKYQKKLRAQLEQEQQANVKLRQLLNEQVEAAGKLHTAFERLKSEVGKPASFEYDDLDIASELKGQLAINEAVVKQMEIQIDELEADRLRFLQKLRDQARLAGHKLYEQHGLTTEQWSAVEEFIDCVKRSPETAKRLLQPGYTSVKVGDKEQSARQAKDQQNAEEELKKKLDINGEENALLLKDIERLQSELDEARSQTQVITITESVAHPDDGRSEILRALEAAKAKSRRQGEVIYHLRAEIAALQKDYEQKNGKSELSQAKETDKVDQTQDTPHGKLADELHVQVNATTRASTDTKAPIVNQVQGEGDDVSFTTSEERGFAQGAEKNRPVFRPAEECKHVAGEYNTTALAHSRQCEGSKPEEGWIGHADDIALVVAKAIEKQFAILQAQKASVLTPVPSGSPTKATTHDVDSSCSNALTHYNDEGDTMHVSLTKSASPLPCRTIDDLAFESENEMIQQVDFLRELNVCLDELVVTETRNEELQQKLHEHEKVFQSLMDQHTILYQHFFQMHTQYTNAERRLRNELDQVKHDNKDFTIKCQRYEAGLHLLGVQDQSNAAVTCDALISGNEAQLRLEVIELTRKVAAHEVNEARLKRKYQQLHNEWRGSTEHNKLLQHEWSEMEKTLKYRVLYLETWKQGADEMMERMEKTLEKSVLRDFADKQNHVMTGVLKRYNALSESYGEMHRKYLVMYDVPAQLRRAQHNIMVLQAEKNAKRGVGEASCDPEMLQNRINQLENELKAQSEYVKELEEASCKMLLNDDELVQLPLLERNHDDDNALRNENTLLYERINEVEQLYGSLLLECAKYKDIATLAASQATVLAKRYAQEQGNREHQEEQLRELMASSEDHAIVGELQHQLMQIKATYQQFLVQYDLLTETQQQTLLKNQRLELEMEKKSQELTTTREKTNDKVQILENAICQVKDRDWTARNTKWEAFRKRLDALEDEILVEQQRRKQLEKDLEDSQARVPLLNLRQERSNQSEVDRLKSRVGTLETRERLLMGQLEAAAKATGWKEKEMRLQTELLETKTLNGDLMRQIETIQSRISELLRKVGELEAEKRELKSRYEELELDLENARTRLSDEERRQQNIHGDTEHVSSHSSLMREKVGLYEKDQAELQQAAQVTIASLKQLVEEKNSLINEYQRKLAVVRSSSAQDKAQDRLETTQLNKKLYDENQRMIAQLKEAMSTISSMERSGKSKQALQAAQERHDHVLQEWKQAEIALENAKQSIRELQMERDVLQNERDLAEARAGEALEEIVLLKEKVTEGEQHSRKVEHQIAFIKQEMSKKEEKLKLLREAIIKLKEEFLKAEDRHAIEIAKAQHMMNHDFSARKRKEKERREEEEDEWQEEKKRLQSQVQMLQEKLALLRKAQNQQERRKHKVAKEKAEEKESGLESDPHTLRDEVERLKQLLKDKALSEARTVEKLEKRMKILQAQNLALREASAHAPAVPVDVADAKAKREQLENEHKLQRRVEIMMLRLKEKQADVTSKDNEIERCNERISKLEYELQSQGARYEKERLAQNATASNGTSDLVKQQVQELKQQNAFLQETLVLKRKEWEGSFSAQMEKYEVQLQRLRRRLVQHGISLNESIRDDGTNAAKWHGASSRLQREEQHFLVGQEVHAELLAMGDELRNKEQDMMAKDTKLLELELEVESLRLEHKRLQRKNQRDGGDLSSSDDVPKQRRGAKGRGNKGRGSSWVSHERLELEEVIENMKKVIEKLRTENEKLKKAAAKQASISPERVDSMRRKLKEQKEARERLEVRLEKLQHEGSELKKDKLKLQQKLRAKTASISSLKNESALELQLKEKERQLLESEQEMAELRHQVLQLEVQIERDVKEEEDAQEQQERLEKLQTQVLELEDENTKLTNELAAFDEDFFEEIEDLKYKYTQAVRDKRQLEKQLAQGIRGVSPASTCLRHSRS